MFLGGGGPAEHERLKCKREVLFCTGVLVLGDPFFVCFVGLEGTWRGLGTDLEGTWRGLEGDLRGLGRDVDGTWKGLEGS